MNGVISGETLTGVINTESELTGVLTNPKTIDLSSDTITPSDLKYGVKAHDSEGTQITGSMVDNGAVIETISTKNEEYTIHEGYHNGNGKVSIDSSEQEKIIPENIKKDVNILGVTGTLKGGYGYTKLGEAEVTVNTSSTAQTQQLTIECGEEAYTKDRMIYVRVRDKAGYRNGYFYGTDNFFFNTRKASGSTYDCDHCARVLFNMTNYGTYYAYTGNGYGLYGFGISSSGTVKIYSRYSASYSGIINGTYKVEVYSLDYPDGISPFTI